MARIINYEQDDDKPFGVGTHYLDDGSSYYMDDPARARSVLEELYGKDDDLLSKVSKETDDISAKLAPAPPPEPMRRAVAGPGGGDLDERTAELGQELDRASGREEPEPTPREEERPPPSQDELEKAEAARRVANTAAAVPRYTYSKGVDPEKMNREGVAVAKKVTTDGAQPDGYYEAQAKDRATVFDQGQDLVRRQHEENELVRAQQVEALRKQNLDAAMKNSAREAEVKRTENKYKEDRAWLEKDVDSYYDKAKPDPDKIFKDRGVFGNIASAIAQFMGAYASVISGSPNFANQILNKKIDNNIDAQIEEFKSGKAKRGGQLQRMADRGMGIDEMKSALRIQQELVVQREVKAAALADGSREAGQARDVLLQSRTERWLTDEQTLQTASLGKVKQEADVVQPVQGGRVAKTQLQIDKETLAGLEVQNKIGFQAGGGEVAERAEERGDKKADEFTKRRTDYGNRLGPLKGSADASQAAVDELQKIQKEEGHLPGVGPWDVGGVAWAQSAGSAVGSDYMKKAGRVKQLLKQIVNGAVANNKGSASEGDVTRTAEGIMGPNASEEQVWAGVQGLNKQTQAPLVELNSTYSDVVQQQKEERDKELQRRAKEAAEKRKSTGKAY